jgi:outer membrane protein insertion porin family
MLSRGHSCLVVLITVIWTSGCNRAKDQWNPEGKEISSLVIRNVGSKTIAEERVRSFTHLEVGSACRAEKIDDNIRSLYESGLVDDVRFLTEPDGDKVRLVAEITARGAIPVPDMNGVSR